MSNAEPAVVTTEIQKAGSAVPAHRQCTYTKSDGHRCRDWAIRGQDHCARHRRYVHYSDLRPVEVPLLEDEDSVILVLSETLRALAWGMIPVSNGRALLDGCRLAHSIHGRRLETAKFRLQLRRLSVPENEIFDSPAASPDDERAAGSSACETPKAECVSEPCAPSPAPAPEPSPEAEAEPGAGCPAPESDPILNADPGPAPTGRFRDLKKNWDKELFHGESELTDMYFPRPGESRQEFRDSRATPFQDLAREEAVEIAVL